MGWDSWQEWGIGEMGDKGGGWCEVGADGENGGLRA